MSFAAFAPEITADLPPELITFEEYLAAEELTFHKHEFACGKVYAMSGGLNRHTLISSNVGGLLYAQLRGQKCRYFNSDMKVLVRKGDDLHLYYPDAQVVCRPAPQDQQFQEEPVVVVEVISESSRRTDEQEKRDAYLSLESLQVYLLLEQDRAEVRLWRRHATGFQRERWVGLGSTVPLPEIGANLSLLEIYETVEFPCSPASNEVPGV